MMPSVACALLTHNAHLPIIRGRNPSEFKPSEAVASNPEEGDRDRREYGDVGGYAEVGGMDEERAHAIDSVGERVDSRERP
jgi:hypothetical protein